MSHGDDQRLDTSYYRLDLEAMTGMVAAGRVGAGNATAYFKVPWRVLRSLKGHCSKSEMVMQNNVFHALCSPAV